MTSKKIKQIAVASDSDPSAASLAVFALCEDDSIHWTWAHLNKWRKLDPIPEDKPESPTRLPVVGEVKEGWSVIGTHYFRGIYSILAMKNGVQEIFGLESWRRMSR
jgi:hypothetical protein